LSFGTYQQYDSTVLYIKAISQTKGGKFGTRSLKDFGKLVEDWNRDSTKTTRALRRK
jgi:hypothetical protein